MKKGRGLRDAPPVTVESPLKTTERIESRITSIFVQF